MSKTKMNNLLGLAIAIAAEGFKDRFDKAGEPYMLHCIRIMMKMETVAEKILAILHDCVEDGVTTIELLRNMEFPEDILDDLKLLTHNKGEDYLDVYIVKIAMSPRATKVKKEDLHDNSDITRLKGLAKADVDRMYKYHKAYTYLKNI